MKKYDTVLTIAGSDPSGGAGIEADIKTISAHGCYASTVITAVVNENTQGVYGIHPIPIDMVVGQIESVLTDIGADAVKIGMLYSAELVAAVASVLRKHNVKNIVVDPVMVATSGDALMKAGIAEALNIYKPKVPTVFNTSGYLSAEQISMLSGCVDIYLFDFKYINGEKAKKYSFAPDYPEIAKVTGSNVRSLRVSYHNAKEKLKEYMEEN